MSPRTPWQDARERIISGGIRVPSARESLAVAGVDPARGPDRVVISAEGGSPEAQFLDVFQRVAEGFAAATPRVRNDLRNELRAAALAYLDRKFAQGGKS